MKLTGNGLVITLNEAGNVIEDGAVLYDGSVIKEVGITSALREKYPDAEYTDVKGKVIMPGLINAHSHIYSAMARGMFLKNARTSHNFVEVLENLWWQVDKELSPEELRYSAYHTYMESIRYGVTTLFDHHASYGDGRVLNSLGVIGDVAAELGIRTSLCFEVSDRNGAALAEQSVQENLNCIRTVQAQNSPLIDAMVGLHASFTITDATMDKCAQIGSDYNCGFHVHVAEGAADAQHCVDTYGKRVIERLQDFAMLGEKSIAVHCIHINEAEMDLLAETDTAVVHNPESNMGNAVGCANIPLMMKKGILTGLGTDAYTQDMFESLKVANIIHKHVAGDPSAITTEAQQMLLDGNRRIAARHFMADGAALKMGVLENGAQADFIVVDYIPNTPVDAGNYTGHITFGLNGGMVNSTIIAGKTVLKDREFVNIDEEKIYRESRAAAARLWSRMEARNS